ncbi:MAG: hypothetical protein WDM89_22080 [Rhizomicrobium sp.]
MGDQDKQLDDLNELVLGMLDAMFSISLALTNRGVITQEELACAFEATLEQQQSRSYSNNALRQFSVKTLARLARMPTYDSGFKPVVIDGGKGDEL